MKIINKKEFAKTTLNKNVKFFVVHIAFFSLRTKMIFYPTRNAKIVLVIIEKVSKSILAKSLNFIDIFPKKLIAKLLEYLNI